MTYIRHAVSAFAFMSVPVGHYGNFELFSLAVVIRVYSVLYKAASGQCFSIVLTSKMKNALQYS